MACASYFDPERDETVHAGRIDERNVAALVSTITSLSSGRGHPAIELVRDDGSALSIGTDGQRAFWYGPTRSATVSTAWAAREKACSFTTTLAPGAKHPSTNSSR